ncbi:hypothetical protein G5714_001545 [Onychostoma macrolepis]|uniref:Uncharacterized protein n=1 Tax=Onychostoma macrolepis TaxID=369639 RepID=A0A7J6DCJ4_9TELE|nr:hypothetical protein G5714_001545 [Onychostoma macrolepis]
MSGRFNGVQAKLKEVCPDSVFVHCTNHSLDLVLQEVAREVRLVADTLNFVREVTVIINDSSTVLGLFACVTLFTPCEAVARLHQGTKVTALGSMEAGKLLCKQLGTLRQDETITDLVAKTKQYAERYGLKPPHPVRSSKTPARFHYTQVDEANDQECSEVEVYPNVWKREMFEALDLVRSEVERRFDQVGIQVAAGREQASVEAAQGKTVNVTSLQLTGFTREQLSHESDIYCGISVQGVKLTQFGMLCPFSKPRNHKPVPCCQRWKSSSNYACACPYLSLHQSAPSRLCAG